MAKNILILDDEQIVCDRLKPELEKHGFAVETSTESQKALERISVKKFDILITDLKMRGPTGMDVLTFVRDFSPQTKVIVITGFATAETARKAMKEGAVDFIAKPFKIRDLKKLVLQLAQEE